MHGLVSIFVWYGNSRFGFRGKLRRRNWSRNLGCPSIIGFVGPINGTYSLSTASRRAAA